MAAEMDSGAEIVQLATCLEVLKILECPVCMEVPFPPIFNCKRGHIVCHVCRPRLTACVLCKEDFSDGRNFVAESIVLSSKHICKFHQFGCEIQQDGHSMAEHIKVCIFRNGPLAIPIPKPNPNPVETKAIKAPTKHPTHSEPVREATKSPSIQIEHENLRLTKFKLSAAAAAATPHSEYQDWSYAKLKLCIETSSSLKILEDCRNEMKRRLIVSSLASQTAFIQKRSSEFFKNSPTSAASTSIRPAAAVAANSDSNSHVQAGTTNANVSPNKEANEPIPIPSAPPLAEIEGEAKNYFVRIFLTNPMGVWYAHFLGENVVRQMEIRRGAKPILIWVESELAEKMFELRLSESGLMDDKEAEISKNCFEVEWVRYGGKLL